MCRALCKVFSDFQSEGKLAVFKTLSLHDEDVPDGNYIEQNNFKGFKKFKTSFGFAAIANSFNADIVILSHINLLLFGKIIKIFSPKKRILLIAHGIEVWEKLSLWKQKFLQKKVEIWAVSSFTAKKMAEINAIPIAQIKVLNNCLDPFFEVPKDFSKPQHLLIRYGLTEQDKVIFSLARLSSSEQYKGYDKVLEAMQGLPKNTVYVLAGSADEAERKRILNLIGKYGLTGRVFLAGFVLESELSDYYLLADVFAMPSSGEGFGISFIEAAACGCPSIAGNIDGSTDALLHGELGKLVDPNHIVEIKSALEETLAKNDRLSSVELQKKCIENFGFEQYKEKVFGLLFKNATIDVFR